MSLGFPSWYVGGFPDREKVVQAWLTPFLNTITVYDSTGAEVLNGDNTPRRPTTCSWLPVHYDTMLPLVRVFRGGGMGDPAALRDPATVQLGVIASIRDDSQDLLEFCIQMLTAAPRGAAVKMPDGSHVALLSVERTLGPEMPAELNPDDRLVTATLTVDVRLPRTVPDYGPIVAALSANF